MVQKQVKVVRRKKTTLVLEVCDDLGKTEKILVLESYM